MLLLSVLSWRVSLVWNQHLLIITEPRNLKLVTVSRFCYFILISVLMPLVLFVISLVFSVLISMP